MGDGASWLTTNAMLRGMLSRVLPLLIFLVVTMPRLPLMFRACSFGASIPLSVAHLSREGTWVSAPVNQGTLIHLLNQCTWPRLFVAA